MSDGSLPTIWNNYVWSMSWGLPTNPDQIYPRLCPDRGCIVCGAAWTDVIAYGCMPDYPLRAQCEYLEPGNPNSIKLITEGFSRPAAVRLRCCSGHVVEYNGRDMRNVSMMPMVLGLETAVALFFATNSMYGKMGTPIK